MRKKYINGMTYLEILVVLMIITALTSLVSIKFSNTYDAEEVKHASEILFSDCFFARSMALAKNENITLKNVNKNSYIIVDQKGILIKKVNLPKDLTILGKDSGRIIFFKNGTTLGNTFEIKKIFSKKYVIVSLLGRVRMSDNEAM